MSYAWVREAAPEVPVVVLTGDTSQETEFSVLASGAEDYLVKSQMSGSLLLQAIRAAVSENKRQRQNGAAPQPVDLPGASPNADIVLTPARTITSAPRPPAAKAILIDRSQRYPYGPPPNAILRIIGMALSLELTPGS